MTKIVSDKITGFDLNGDKKNDFITITKSIADNGAVTTY